MRLFLLLKRDQSESVSELNCCSYIMTKSLIGIGLRQPHIREFLEKKPDIGWIEVHSENYMFRGSPSHDALIRVRENYPVSLHGIGMSLGSASGLNQDYLVALKELVADIEPFLLSDHLSWSNTGGYYMADLLPVPYNNESLKIFEDNINKAQDYLQRQIAFENPSTYFEYENSDYDEPEFMNILAKKTGAKILLDVNNVYTSGLNNGWNNRQYIASLDMEVIQEIHVSGHSQKKVEGSVEVLYIDSHDNPVSGGVWDLYKLAIERFGNTPTLMEWDSNMPNLEKLILEAKKAEQYLCVA
jgi:hypothetical protein